MTCSSGARSSCRSGCAWRPCPGASLEEIERVYSHIQALGQADAFLRRRPWALLTTYNTAGAGRLIRERAESRLGGRPVAPCRGLFRAGDPGRRDRERSCQPDPVPAPRATTDPFPADWRRPIEGPAAPRTTLAFAVRNEPGTLLAVLQVLADRRLNLSTLESRPSRQVAWEYVFWADIDADLLASVRPAHSRRSGR